MIIRTAVASVEPAQREQVVAAMTQWSQIARQIPGVTTHGFYALVDDETSIRFYAEWESAAALEATTGHPGLAALWDVLNATGTTVQEESTREAAPIEKDA